jgi:HSP20 family molecular chaperone IbpA
VAAQIRIEPEAADTGGGSELRAEGGRFEIDVAPGRYRVTISAPGFETQNRKVEVEENGVTLLNVDLRSER